MNALDFEYAIKKDVRNNPIVREVDEARQKQLWRTAGIGAVLVAVLLFQRGSTSSWCGTGTRFSGCSGSARPRKKSTVTFASRSRRCARQADRVDRHEAAPPHRAGTGPGDRHRAGGADRGARQVHRRGPVTRRRSSGGHVAHQQEGEAVASMAWRATLQSRLTARRRLVCCLDHRDRGPALLLASRGACRAQGTRRSSAARHHRRSGEAGRDSRPPRPRARLQRRRRHHLRQPARERRA